MESLFKSLSRLSGRTASSCGLVASLLVSALGQSPSYKVGGNASEPRMFAESMVSTVDDEIGGSFSPDGTEFYFSRLVPYTTLPRLGLMCVSRSEERRGGKEC